jgi:glycine/D-amino acid oxidase-like deaminating enzyme
MMTDRNQRRAIVVGGSMGGLTAALLLRDLGFDVDVFERGPPPLVAAGARLNRCSAVPLISTGPCHAPAALPGRVASLLSGARCQ